jgi:FKBP-type peptidyl-prolyl cis-trans isomerase
MSFKTLSIVLLSLVLFSSCIKDKCTFTEQNKVATSLEIDSLRSYFAANNITNAIQDPSGAFYVINTQGTGGNPGLCNTVVVNYGAYRFNYSIPFDSNTSSGGISFVLGTLITGVQKIMPHLQVGGTVTMYIPPSLAYGSTELRDQSGSILLPANSYIKFRMTLLSMQ